MTFTRLPNRDPIQHPILGRLGNLVTRLARSADEIEAAQRLRFQVFYEEMGATWNYDHPSKGSDTDEYDHHCDHLLVLDGDKVVGTYRLMLPESAENGIGFYSNKEFDLSALLTSNKDKRLLELGRSCILPQYRTKRTLELLWGGTWAYALQNKIDILFGCASFPGTDLQKHRDVLAWLQANVSLNTAENCTPYYTANSNNSIDLGALMSGDAKGVLSDRRAIALMPPLLKGYLRLGAKIASHAVVDHQFGTIDVLVVLKTADINPRYVAHYGADASRFDAQDETYKQLEA